MELVFNLKTDRWEAEFEATADFNLHIEGVKEGNVSVFQRGSAEGEYAFVRNSTPYPSLSVNVYDYDFAAVVYPKYIKVSCATEPTMAVVTSAGAISEGGNTPEGGNGENSGSSVIHLTKEQKEVEVWHEDGDYYETFDLFVDVEFDLDKKEIVRDGSYKLTREGGENGEEYYRENITSCEYRESNDTLYFRYGDTYGYTLSMIPNRDIIVERFNYVDAEMEYIDCKKGLLVSLNVDIAQAVVDGMYIRRDWDY